MRRALLLIAMMSLLAVVLAAQQVVMRSPNVSARLKKGNVVNIEWGCVQCSGTTELHLVRLPTRTVPGGITATRADYQTIGVIKASIPVNPGAQSYSYSWRVGDYIGGSAQLGDGYKILVRIVLSNGTLSDVSDSPFAIGAAPTIDTFAINDGLAVTEQKRVTLSYRFSGFPIPGRYRVRCKALQGTLDTLGPWMSLSTTSLPVYDLPDAAGDYSISLTLANDFGESPAVIDTVRYAPPVPMKDYTIKAATLVCGGFPDMDPAWYSCRCTSVTMSTNPPATEDCSCTSTGGVVVKTKGLGLGTKVEYEFFGGRQLNEGWSFVSLSYSDAACRDHAGHAVLIMPQPGSRNILFKIRLWTEGVIGGGIGAFLGYVCEFHINSIVIRGPGDKPVSEAFK
jgi:hypothetical protein